MDTWLNRRRFLQASGLAAAGLAVAACDTAPSRDDVDKGGGGKKVRWWDHSPNLQAANKKMFKAFENEPGGMPVEYTYHQTSKLGQALQLAKQSGQLPDVHTNVGLNLPLAALIKQGWYQPLDLPDDARARLDDNKLLEGIHTFDGKLYSFPIAADKQYWAATWFNTQLVSDAGLDPDDPPRTYDEFRAAARKVSQSGGDGVFGWIFNLGFTGRVSEQVNYLAQAAGFEGHDGRLFASGEIAYHDQAYLDVLEFLLSLHKDKLLVPGSISMNDKVARARWATGVAGFYFDGPWCAGIVRKDLSEFRDKLGVGPMLVPEAGKPVTAYRNPQGGMFWLSGEARQPDGANQLLGHLTGEDYAIAIANAMAQPPPDFSVLDEADVYPEYKKLIGWFAEDAFAAPVPVVGNPDVAKVEAQRKDVHPDLGELVQGMFSGDVTDVRGSLKKLSDKATKDRERALAVAKKEGAKVSADDWGFPNWRPRRDYTKSMYA